MNEIIDQDTTKLCNKCGEKKPKHMFSKDRSKKDGLCTKCKSCTSSYYAINRDRILSRERDYYVKNKRYINKRNAQWRSTHREEEKNRKALYRLVNKSHISRKQADNYRRRRELIAERRRIFSEKVVIYLGGCCVHCGLISDHYEIYHCHHSNPAEKLFQVSAMVSKDWKEVVTELDKCVLLCVECHNVETSKAARKDKDRSQNAIYKAQKRDDRKRQCVEYLGGRCQICGRMHSELARYEFHHVNPEEKTFSIAPNILKPWATLQAELNKCVLLDGNCHASIKVGRYRDISLIPGPPTRPKE